MAKGGIIGNLRVNMGLDSAQFQAGVAQVSKSMDGLGKKAAMFGAAVSAAMTAAAGAMAVAVHNVIAKADQLAYVADRLGVSVEALQELRYAADRAGMGVQNFDVALRRFIRRASEAALGTGAAKDAFKELGVSLVNAQGRVKNSSQLLNEVADAMQNVQNPADKLRLAFKLFDTDGAAMVNVLAKGSAGLREMGSEARGLGLVLSEEAVRGAQEFKSNLDLLNKAKDGLITQITARLLPSLNALSQQFVGLVNDASKVKEVADGIAETLRWVGESVASFVVDIHRLRVELGGLVSAFVALKEGDFSGAWRAFSEAQASAARIREEFVAGAEAFRQQERIMQRFSDAFGVVETQAPAVVESFASIGRGAKEAADRMKEMQAEAARIFNETRLPLERYQATIERLNELLAAGVINQDTYNRAVAQAQDAFEQAELAGNKARQTMEQIGQSISGMFSNAFQGLIDGSKRAQDVLADLLSQLGNMMMNSAFQALFSGGVSGGGILGGLLGGLGIPGFATGTNFAPGGLAVVGERGPELVNLPRGTQVIPNHAIGERRGGISVDARTTIDARGADQAGLARLEAAMMKRDAEFSGRVVAVLRDVRNSTTEFG